MAEGGDTLPLLAEEGSVNVRQRVTQPKPKREETWELPPDWNPDLPYGGKVFLARKKKPDPWWVTTIEVTVIICAVCFAYYAYFYFDHLHYNVTKGYAQLGYSAAQHQVGHHLLLGKGVEKDGYQAMEWFKKASDQGHPHAAYNLAVGHMKGIRTDLLDKGEAHHLIAHAARNGVEEANQVLNTVCGRGGCD